MLQDYHQHLKTAGVLLHISSLPNANLGEDAYRFVDFLHSIGLSVWQTLPLNMPHDDGSPYQCLSAHAGNPALIDLLVLQKQGWLSADDYESYLKAIKPKNAQSKNAQMTIAKKSKSTVLATAYANFEQKADKKVQAKFKQFCKQHGAWLDQFALFLALRQRYAQASWSDWPQPFKDRDIKALKAFANEHAQAISSIKFTQFVFFEQWHALKQYANSKGIKLFGDVPIFVAYDSADVWAQPHLFKLDQDGTPTVVAGVPPDYFSATGQRWGNPHYNWQAMQADGFAWWVARMATQNSMFDIVRIDHFRGLQAAWEIPASEPTAINGEWVEAPGDALLSAITQHFPQMQLVAEDLGIITDEVNALRLKHLLPGMKILQFAFDGSDDNPYLPKNITADSVAYTGTHDNDTTLGWYQQLTEEQKLPLHQYLNNPAPNMPEALIEIVMESNAEMAIIPMQDCLKLGTESRMNVPGTIEGNWLWHFEWAQIDPKMSVYLSALIAKSQRKH